MCTLLVLVRFFTLLVHTVDKIVHNYFTRLLRS